MKKIFFAVFAVSLFMSVSPTNDNKVKLDDPDTCERMANGVYHATLDEDPGNWQQANENHHKAYTSCCFNYPNDCGGLVIISAE